VTRRAVLLLLLFIVPANAQPAGGFDPALITNVYAAALAFMAPRTLDPVPVGTLTVWGLRGLTALDPSLTAELRDGNLVLAAGDRVVLTEVPPAGQQPAAWAAAVVRLYASAMAVSPAIRRAGTQAIIQSFFDEMFNHLDPYSRYAAPAEAAEDRAHRNGSAGLGITLAQHDATIVVQQAVSDGPAVQAGLDRGDTILAVDGEPVRQLDVGDVERLMAGPEGTGVRISWRNSDGHPRSADLVRALVPPETVFPDILGDMLVLRISSFSESTASHLEHDLRQGLADPRQPAGIVLDLRGNRGGLLRQAVEAADMLLPAGMVATTKGRDPNADHAFTSGRGEMARDMPVVVLVDGRTASAAEILTAALADRGRAVVVGSSTLGKGLVQTIDPLPDGGELFVTWSRVLAPRGWPIQGLGVLPQVCTSLGEAALHRQLAALAEGLQPASHDLAVDRAMRPPLQPAEVVAIRNTCPAGEGSDLDFEAADALIDNPAAYAAALLPPMGQPIAP
jgi:carboxyl-terminal processing protease